MKKKLSMILAMLMLILCLPVSAAAVSETEEVTIQTEIFSGFDITIPKSIAEKYRWSEGGLEGANWIHFYDRSKFDESGGKSSYEEADEEKGYLFSIRQYCYDGDYRYGMGDPLFYELFQPTRNDIVAFYSRDDLSRLMILSVEYADSAPVSVQKEALKISGYMTPKSDVCLEDVDANPWNLKFANFLLNGRFRTMGQEYLDDTEMQACLYDVAGNDYPELIITNGAADGQSTQAYIYTFSENWQVEYLRIATEEELNAMSLQPFTAIRGGWGDFLEACGYQIKYLHEHSYFEEQETGIPISYAGATVDFKESLFEKSAYEYDNELAKLGGMLSCAVEKSEQDVIDLLQKMEVDGYYTKNFGKDEMFAFAVAHKEMRLNGEDAVVLFVIARGSTNNYEYFSDFVGKTNRFYDYTAYDYATRFFTRITDGISKYIGIYPDLLDKPLKVFVTGHSLGGAGANLVAANFTLYEWWSNYLSNEDVFAYTYGAIDSIDVKTPVKGGYENIHNIYNFYDTFGPNGRPFFTTSGNSGKGKFGHIDQFGHPYTTNPFLDDNHLIENYLSSIVQREVRCKSAYSQTAIHCPVDVEVLRNGEVVGRITDNQVDESLLSANPEVALMVVEDSKYIAVFDNPEAYSLRITVTNDGEMSVSTVSFDDTGESCGAGEYTNVVIKNGQEFFMDLSVSDSTGKDPQTPELLVMDGDKISGKVNSDGSISPVNGTGNGLQLALLAVIVIVSGLIVFLWKRKIEETKKLKFSIASIFTVILAFGLLANLQWMRARNGWMDSKIGYRMVVEFGSTCSAPHILYQVLLIGSMILLAVLLFMRKRNSLLAGALAIQALLPAFTLESFLLNGGSRGFFDVYEYELHLGPMMWAIGICGCYVLEILCYLFLTLMAITPCAEDGEHKRGLHRLWFLPGVLSIFITFAHLVGNIYFMRSDLYCLSILSLIPMTFFMGWWLTRPYKKERAVYQIPIAQPCGQTDYQATNVSDTTQKVLCSGCGQELSPEENFCRVCGKQRTTLAQGALPVFQQQINPQIGYVQDTPSGGMTALGFFFPIVGLILYLVWKDQTPRRAHSAGKGALIGVIVWTALSIILAILAYVVPLLVFYSYY